MNIACQAEKLRQKGEQGNLNLMEQEQREADDGKLATTWQNRAAGRALRVARSSMTDGISKQAAFASRLSRQLGIPISVSSLSNWENGRRTVPGAVLLEAAFTSESSLDAILGEVGEPEVTNWAEKLGFPERVAELEMQMAAQKETIRSLAQIREELAASGQTMARVVNALDEAGIWDASDSTQNDSSELITRRASSGG
ncbi:MAG: helix-turn-helix domain-containing protein [Candidatus Dormibacteraceae bacterium]